MKHLAWIALLSIAGLPAAALAAPKPVKTSPARQDWLQTFTQTAEGAVVIGNPAAKVKLVEYLSLTCPHCAHLAGEALPPLKRDYIAKGLVSLEVRHAVRDGYDFVASLLIRCQPRRDYLGSLEALFADQAGWQAKGSAASASAGFESKTPEEKMAFVAHSAGFDAFFAGRGMTSQRYSACMADKAAMGQLEQMAGNSWNRDAIPGTPAFRLNGTMLGSLSSWDQLEAKIKAALG